MSASMRANSAPSSSRPELDARVMELNFQVPEESRKTQPAVLNNHILPDELLVSLTSTVSNRNTMGHTAHHRHCKGCGIRRPDAVWHHQLGRKKYKFFLEQPTSLSGAGRDISFLCDASGTQRKTTQLPPLTDKSGMDTQNLCVSETLIPEEYHIVKNKGLQSLEFFEDAFTVQLQDDEQKLRVFPSLRPSGRLEVIQLMKMMDDMLKKAGVDQQIEELTELSQMEGLLELVQVEQSIYNIVFHELIRQVSVGCAERGQLLAKLRQRYQSLLERIPSQLKALHTEVVAQRALDRRLTEEIHRIKTSIQRLNTELSRLRDYDASVRKQAHRAHRQLAEALEQTETNSDVVQRYHELYELHRVRLEAQLVQITEDRDCWSKHTFCLGLKVISLKKLQLIHRLHVIDRSWFKTAEQCSLYLSLKDTDDLNTLTEFTDHWRAQLTVFMSQLKKTKLAQSEEISSIKQGIAKWIAFCTKENQCPQPEYDNADLKQCYSDMKNWSNILVIQCDRYQGETLLCCQQELATLGNVLVRWLNVSLELFRRHPSLDGEPCESQHALRELDNVLSEILKQLDTQVSGESGIHGQMTCLLGLMECQMSKLGKVIDKTEMMPASDWMELENALQNWNSLAENVFRNTYRVRTENEKDKNEPDIFTQTEEALDKVREFIISLSNFADVENQKIRDEIISIHMGQTRWMLDLLLVTVPEHREDHEHEQEHCYITDVSPQTLDKDAKRLAEKLNFFSLQMSSACKQIMEEQILLHPHEVLSEDEMNECRKLQKESTDWVESSVILLTGLTGGPVELPVQQADPASSVDVPVSPPDSVVNKEVSAEPKADGEFKDETEEEPIQGTAEGHDEHQVVYQGELMDIETPVVKLISYDSTITQRKLGESHVHLNETEDLVLSPATDEAHKAFSDLTTIDLLQQELRDSELRVHSAEQRAFKAEEALQAALETIQDQERQLQGRASLMPHSSEEKKHTSTVSPPPVSPPPLSPPTVTTPAPPKKTGVVAKPTTSTKKTKKR